MIDTFLERIEEARLSTLTDSTDLMASFKKRLAKGEVDVHHHHAEFNDPLDDELSDAPDHDHDDEHGHIHIHSHSHGVYRHIAHPHGPRTMIDQGVCCCFMSQFPQEVIDDERAGKTSKN